MNIADLLRRKADSGGAPTVVTIAATESVGSLVGALADHNVGALLVVEDSGSTDVKGIVSERDVVRRIASNGSAVLDTPVGEIMTSTVLSCTSADDVHTIAETMTQRRIRHMPVIDDGTLAGIVSIGDVVAARIAQLEQDRSQLEQYISG